MLVVVDLVPDARDDPLTHVRRTKAEPLDDPTDGAVTQVAPLPLRKLRERHEANALAELVFDDDEGEGCGVCFLAPNEEVEVAVA